MQDYEDVVGGRSCWSRACSGAARPPMPASPIRTLAPMASFTHGEVPVDQSRSFVNVGGQHGEWVAETSFMYVGRGRGEFTPALDAAPSTLAGMGLGELEELPHMLPRLPDVRSQLPPVGMSRQLIAWVACALVGLIAIWLLVPESDGRMDHDLQRPSAVEEPGDVIATGREDLASIVNAVVKQEASADKVSRFDVALDHTKGERFGFRLSSEYNSLYLAEIDYNDGLLSKWNREHPNRQLHVGDRIIEVNGIHGSSLHLLQEANKLEVCNMKIMRIEEGPLQQAEPVMFYTIFLDRTSGRVFGADVVRADTSLVLKRIHSGLFGEWNQNNPATIVYPGDRIVQVNHVDGTGKKLLGECANLRVLEMRLVRGKGFYTKHLYEDTRLVNTAPWGRAWGEEDLEEVTTHHPSVPLPSTATSTTVTTTSTTRTATSTTSTSRTGTSTTVTHTTVTTTTASSTTSSTSVTTSTGTGTRTTTATITETMPPGQEYIRGLKAEFFYHIDEVPDLDLLPIDQTKINRVLEQSPDMVRIDPQVYYPLTLYGWPGVGEKEFYITRWTGQLVIKQGGNYTFQLKSDDGSDIKIDGKRLNGGDAHGFEEHVWQASPKTWMELFAGGHDFSVTYFNIKLHAGIIAMYQGPDTNGRLVPIPALAFRHRSIDLPKELLKDAIYLKRYDGASRFHDSPVTSSTMFLLTGGVCSLLLMSGVIFYGAKLWRRRRDSTRRGSDDLAGLIDSDRRSLRRCELPVN